MCNGRFSPPAHPHCNGQHQGALTSLCQEVTTRDLLQPPLVKRKLSAALLSDAGSPDSVPALQSTSVLPLNKSDCQPKRVREARFYRRGSCDRETVISVPKVGRECLAKLYFGTRHFINHLPNSGHRPPCIWGCALVSGELPGLWL